MFFNVLLISAVLTPIFAQDNEFYCRIEKGSWEVCRTCNDINKDCDGTSSPTDGCRCEDIKIADSNYELIGGWDQCNTKGWCHVKWTEPQKCSDQEGNWSDNGDLYSPDPSNDLLAYIWLHNNATSEWNGLVQSKEACSGTRYNTGNEEILEGVKISEDRLRNVENNGTLGGEFSLFAETSSDCKEECSLRPGSCGAWSYNIEEQECYLHTVDSCCGQFGKRQSNINYSSGYHCTKCWSTKVGTSCPCSVEERTQRPGTLQNTGATRPLHNSPTALLQVDETTLNEDVCAYVPRLIGRPNRKRCKPLKPNCLPLGKCGDPRRCRKKPIDDNKHPLC